jgi:hypothetical protein
LRKQIQEEIKTEKRYAAEGAGIIDMRKMYDLQRQLKYLDGAVATVRSDLSDKAAKPLDCSAIVVQKAALCVGYDVIRTFPNGTSPEAVERFCGSDEMQALSGLVDLGESAPYWDGAKQAIIDVSYELDRAHLVARSAEVCLVSKSAAIPEANLKSLPTAKRKAMDQARQVLAGSLDELKQAGLEPLDCTEPVVKQILACVEKGDDTGVKPGCRSPELKEAMTRLWRE